MQSGKITAGAARLGPLLTALIVAVSACFVLAASPANAATAPPEGISLYITSSSITNMHTLGCQMGTLDLQRAGTQSTIVSLEFGGMLTVSGTWGASMYGGTNQKLSVVLSLAEAYATSFWQCTGADLTSTAEVALTTNSSLSITSAAGSAWAGMVNSFGSWLSANPAGNQVLAAGGNDIEPGWSDPAPIRSWVSGYTSNYTRRLLNTGSADGCEYSKADTSTSCGTSTHPGWGPEDIYYISWGAAPAYPLPQIYRTDSVQAEQWYRLSVYFVGSHGTPMYYAGSATQWRSCQHESCGGTNNTVSAGYNQLVTQLARSSSTKQTPAATIDWTWEADQL